MALREMIFRVVILFVGLTIAHLGVTLFLLADLGSDPFNVLIQGLYGKLLDSMPTLPLTHGRVHMCISFLIIIVLLLTKRSYVRIGTLICMFCGGPIIDAFQWLLGPLFAEGADMWIRIATNVVGCAILAYGMTIVIKSEAGTGPNDLVAIVLADVGRKPFGPVRVSVDFCFALVGWLLGGTVGLGTVICAFVVGPVAGVFLPINERLIMSILRKK